LSEEVAIAAFRAALRRAFEDFQADEQRIRGQYARAVQEGEAPAGADDDELLERPTRRFLVDRMLRLLIPIEAAHPFREMVAPLFREIVAY